MISDVMAGGTPVVIRVGLGDDYAMNQTASPCIHAYRDSITVTLLA